jgi:hypothetical protein
MLLAIMLGVIVGVAGTALVRQWLHAELVAHSYTREVLPPADFPRLAPPRRTYVALRRVA